MARADCALCSPTWRCLRAVEVGGQTPALVRGVGDTWQPGFLLICSKKVTGGAAVSQTPGEAMGLKMCQVLTSSPC